MFLLKFHFCSIANPSPNPKLNPNLNPNYRPFIVVFFYYIV